MFCFATPKSIPLHGTASFDVFCFKIRSGVLAVDDFKNPKNERIAESQKRTPLSELNEILQDGRYPRPYHVGQFWWRSVKGYRGGGGRILAFPIDFDRHPSTLSHYRASVWYIAGELYETFMLLLWKQMMSVDLVMSWRWCTAICIYNTRHIFTGN